MNLSRRNFMKIAGLSAAALLQVPPCSPAAPVSSCCPSGSLLP